MSDGFDGLMPVPAQLEIAADAASFELFSDFSYRAVGGGAAGAIAAIETFLRWVEKVRGESIDTRATSAVGARLEVECEEPGEEVPGLDVDESYSLVVDGVNARVLLTAARPAGVLRGLATLLQLSVLGAGSLRGCAIEDRPRFCWRGLMVDVARHFLPIAMLERTLEAMALVKLNVLHLHLTDDQGFRIESKAFPRLHEKGSGGDYYTQDEIGGLVAFAAGRGIRVIPEFDLPGHASSWLAGYPQFGCRPESEYQVVETWGCVDVCVNPLSDGLYEFLATFFADVLPLFPDPYVHIGGDEVFGDEWRGTPAIARHLLVNGLDARDLQAFFNARVHAVLGGLGKRVVGWDEVAHPDMPVDTVVQSWRGAESVAVVTGQGYSCVRSHGYYLNAQLPAAVHYAVDPCPEELGDVAAELVLGGEACMWSEFVDANNYESRVWPRAAAIAERYWSPRSACAEASMPVRLLAVRDMLWRFGVALDGAGGDIETRAIVDSAMRDGLAPQRRDAVIPSRESDKHTALDRIEDLLPVENVLALQMRVWMHRGDHESLASVFAGHAEPADPQSSPWRSALGSESGVLAGRLRRVAEIGALAVACLSGEREVASDWVDDSLAALNVCAEPIAGIAVAIVDPVTELVRAVRETQR
jgi:hexosaminidase